MWHAVVIGQPPFHTLANRGVLCRRGPQGEVLIQADFKEGVKLEDQDWHCFGWHHWDESDLQND